MRNERILSLEERAARLPALMTMPMIGFILPCLFIVVAGPAAIKILNAFN
jgi:tight adherence protein C